MVISELRHVVALDGKGFLRIPGKKCSGTPERPNGGERAGWFGALPACEVQGWQKLKEK